MPTAAAIERRLRAKGEPERRVAVQRFFKTGPGEYGEGDHFLGIRVPVLRKLAAEFRDTELGEVDRLLASKWHEVRLLALLILIRKYRKADAATRSAIFALYVARRDRINNWDLVDVSAEHIVGAHLLDEDRALLTQLARSKSVWDRRIAILSTFHYIRRNEFAETLRIAGMLVGDEHDLIHKAVGWLLREVGQRDRAVEEAFLRKHAARMPRVMLRYAIERFPEPLRRKYLALPRR
jgi:3-methyladenine DNA glycosylase AlkD